MKKLLTQPLILGILLFFATGTIVSAEEIVTGIDNESRNDKVLLHGKVLWAKGRTIYLDDVAPICRGKRSFRVRHKSQSVPIKKGTEVWFWLIGSCGNSDSVNEDPIDIIAKP